MLLLLSKPQVIKNNVIQQWKALGLLETFKESTDWAPFFITLP